MKQIIIFYLAITLPATMFAQQSHNTSKSIFSGGMWVGQSILSTTKFSYDKGHLGIVSDFTWDNYRENWQDGTQSSFSLYGFSVGARYYSNVMGRGLFVEGFGGYGQAKLKTEDSNQLMTINDQKSLPLTGFALGCRFGKKPKGLFGEVAYRATIPLNDLHLYTTESKPDTNGLDNISYQSWIFERGKAMGQVYVGIGYSF